MGEEDLIRHKDSDDELKPKIVEKIFEAYDFYRNGDLYPSFKTFSALFIFIQSRDFPLKIKIIERTQFLEEYFDGLKGRPANKHQQLEFGKASKSLNRFVYEYISDVISSMDYLGLLLKTTIVHNDLHRNLSEQNFGDDLSLASKHRKELEKIESKEIIKLMNNNMIYQIYSLWRYDNAL